MTTQEAIRRLENISSHAVHTFGEEPFAMSLDDGIALKKAIVSLEAWEKVKEEMQNLYEYQHEAIPYIDKGEVLEIIDEHLKEVSE